MKQLTLSLTALALVLFSACTKDKDDPKPAASKKDMIVGGEWKWTGFKVVTVVNGTETLIDGWSEVEECDKDDIMKLSSNGTGTIDEMALKCDPADLQITNITWELLDNETKVRVTDDDGTVTMTIMELTATTARYRHTLDANGTPMTVEQTFTNVK